MTFDPIIPVNVVVPVAAVLLVGVLLQLLGNGGRGRRLRWAWRAVAVLLLAGVALNPVRGSQQVDATQTDLDVVFVVDTTASAAAEDFAGGRTRLSGMQADIKLIARELAGARFAIIGFDREATLQLPLTSDVAAVESAAAVLRPEVADYSRGSSVSQAASLLRDTLQRIRAAEPDHSRIVLYLGDGEQTAEEEPETFAESRPLVEGGLVLGYGTEEGGRMRANDGYGDGPGDYISDNTGDGYPYPDAISKLDEPQLRTIADQLGIDYLHRVKAQGAAAAVRDLDIRTSTSREGTTRATLGTYWMFAIGLGALLLLELALVTGAVVDAARLGRRRGGAA